jgi:hypothetical protein
VGPAALVHEGLGHAIADGKAPPEAGCEVRCGQSQELLVRIQAPTVFGRECPADRSCLNGGEREAGEGAGDAGGKASGFLE